VISFSLSAILLPSSVESRSSQVLFISPKPFGPKRAQEKYHSGKKAELSEMLS
jgi:hypothetical protein